MLFLIIPIYSSDREEIEGGTDTVEDISLDKVTETTDHSLDIVKDDDIPIMDRAIIKDIETSSIEELKSWAISLDLPQSDNIQTLRNSLFSYYNLKPTVKKKAKGTKDIIVKRAELSTYYTLEVIDQSVAEFEGRVKAVIDDKDNETQHEIIADKINFNRTTNSVSAFGDVEYTKSEKGSPEVVVADSLTFKLKNWQGSMLKCISKQKKSIKDEDMTFYYITGEIKKSDSDVMGMKDVAIQTVSGSPYFNITAYDFWMLDPSEFLMIFPSVKIGHVPVLWVPFYYHSENSLYFNPAYGFRPREGAIFQNTIYLMGKKPKNDKESDFSFLSFKDGEGSGVKELNGVSLVSSQDKQSYSSDYSKIMADYYSKLGLYLGNKSKISFKPYVESIDWDIGLGYSRDINSTTGSVFINDSDSKWNSSYLLGDEVHFRYLFALNLNSKILDFKILTMSDSYFKSDFYDREENFMWIDYFTSQLDDGVGQLSNDGSHNVYARTIDDNINPVIESYFWIFNFKTINPEFNILKPYIGKLSLEAKNLRLDFKRTANKSEDLGLNDPLKYFFYPEKANIPLRLTVSGSVFDTSYNKKVETKSNSDNYKYRSEDSLFELDNPYSVDRKDKDKEEVDEDQIFNLEPGTLFSNVNSSILNNNIFSTKLSYDTKLPLTYTWNYDYSPWTTPEDIEYDLKAEDLIYQFDPSASLNYSLNFFNSFVVIEDSLDGYIYNKTYDVEDKQKESDLVSANQWNKTNLKNKAVLTINPLKLFNPIKYHELSLSYSLEKLLYSKEYDKEKSTPNKPRYDYSEFGWDEDYVLDNSLNGTYKFNLGFSNSILTYKKKLDPIEEEFILGGEQIFDLKFNDFTFLIKSKVEYSESFLTIEDSQGNIKDSEEDEWKKDPITSTIKYQPFKESYLSTSIKYDLEDEDFQELKGSIKLWPLTVDINSIYSIEKKWDDTSKTWRSISTLEEDKELRLNNVVTSLRFSDKKFVFWKNRINLNLTSDLVYDKKLIEIQDSNLRLDFNMELDIYKFLTLSFKTQSTNKSMYLYNKEDRERFGVEKEFNIFEDLFKSFNFSNEEDREDSFFNLQKMDVDLIYKMPDWNLILSYSGGPEIGDDKTIEWEQKFSFFIEWKPLSMVRSNIENEDDKWGVSMSEKEE